MKCDSMSVTWQVPENVSSLLSHPLPTTITQPPTIQEFIILIVMFKISPELSITLERSFLVTLILLGEKQRLHISGKSFTFFVVEKVGRRGTLPGVWLAVPLLCSCSPTPSLFIPGKVLRRVRWLYCCADTAHGTVTLQMGNLLNTARWTDSNR